MKICESDNSPSSTDTFISTFPKKSWDGMNSKILLSTVTLPDLLPLFDLFELILAENVKSSPSTSLANNSKLNILSSSLFWLEIEINSGASLAGSTLIEVCLLSLLNQSTAY